MTEPSGGFAPVLALYDFRSKQEYIYRTNRLQEISGASKLIEDIYDRFLDVLNQGNEQNPPYIGLRDTSGNDTPFGFEDFTKDQSIFGQVLYSGGGSLMMLYRSEDIYFAANRRISRMVLEKTQSLSLIAAHIPFDPRQGFRKQRTALYEALARCKSEILPCLPCNVTPFTQTGFTAHMPIAYRQYNGIDRELSRESFLKLQKHREIKDKSTSQLDKAVRKKGEDSLLAIVYIDGNNMGEKLNACLDGCSDNIDDCVAALRGFSADTAKAFVEEPYAAISQWTDTHAAKWLPRAENRWFFRRVIGGGDEITFICTAGLALKLVQLYFGELEKKHGGSQTACAGIAIFHSHAPFAAVYDIAEECCENAKEKARAVRRETGRDGNYFDFYFCRSGLTNDMETLRENEEKGATGLPYAVDVFFERINSVVKPLFDAIGRANIKALTNAVLSDAQEINAGSVNGGAAHAACLYESNRLNAYCGKRLFGEEHNTDEMRQLLFDAGSVCDVWFTKPQNYAVTEEETK